MPKTSEAVPLISKSSSSESSAAAPLLNSALSSLAGKDFQISDVTVLLSLTVFLNQVSDSMPNTSDAVPLISMKAEVSLINMKENS